MNVYLDSAATTQLTPQVKQYIIELLDQYANPSSLYQSGVDARQIINQARSNVAKFINGKSENIIFTSSGSASNSLVIKGLTSENVQLNRYNVFYSPTAHKSMVKACKSCLYSAPLIVSKTGRINLSYLNDILKNEILKPLVCIEAANSEIGTINDIQNIADVVHKYDGLILIDVTGYIPCMEVDMNKWRNIDFVTFSGHKLHALKGVGVVYKNTNAKLNPLVYGSQENGLFAGTENILGIASLGKAVENYDYSSISSKNRDYVYDYIIKNIPNSYLVGSPFEYRLPHNLYMCFKGVQGESLMILLDMNDIQVSTGSACTSSDLQPSSTLTAIGMNKEDINSCIRMTFSGNETKEELDYVCSKLKECVERLRNLSK